MVVVEGADGVNLVSKATGVVEANRVIPGAVCVV